MPDVTGVQQQAHNKVCQDLDDLVLEYIALVNEHLTAWTRISTRFQEVRIHILYFSIDELHAYIAQILQHVKKYLM